MWIHIDIQANIQTHNIQRNKHACMHACIPTYVRTYVRTYIQTYIRITNIFKDPSIQASKHTSIQAYKHTDLPAYMHACMYACIHRVEIAFVKALRVECPSSACAYADTSRVKVVQQTVPLADIQFFWEWGGSWLLGSKELFSLGSFLVFRSSCQSIIPICCFLLKLCGQKWRFSGRR